MMTITQEPRDYDLTYKDVQQILGVSRRTVQTLVSEGKLSREMLAGLNGLQVAMFSSAEVQALTGKKRIDAEPQENKIVRYETGIGMFQKLLSEKEEIIAKRDADLMKMAEQKGKLEGELEQIKPQLIQALKEKEQYKHKIALLEPKIEALTQKRHNEEITGLKTKIEETEKSRSFTSKSFYVALVGIAVLIIVFILIMSNDNAVANISQFLHHR